jgi:hypothetical protein
MAGKPLTTGGEDTAAVVRCLFPFAANEDDDDDDNNNAEELTGGSVGDVDIGAAAAEGGGGAAAGRRALKAQIQPFPLCFVRKCFRRLRSCSS